MVDAEVRQHAALRRQIRRVEAAVRDERRDVVRDQRLQEGGAIRAVDAQAALVAPLAP